SSNFTRSGLTSNRELNLAHKVLLEPGEAADPEAGEAVAWLATDRAVAPAPGPATEERQLVKSEVGARAILDLEAWYDRRWQAARDFKQELIELLDASKFGEKEYTPYQIYVKALFEYLKDDLAADDEPAAERSAVELTEFQADAVRKARKILQRHHGVMVADSVGLGKTWIGKKLLEDYAYHQRMKAIIICPASLRGNWQREIASAAIAARVLSQEELGRDELDADEWGDVDVVLIDESHNFRNPNTLRYGKLERILRANGRRGRAGDRKKVILLTATPINNDLLDLYHQLSLVTIGDKSHFVGCGIGDLYRYFLRARREARQGGTMALFNLLEETVIRRTRPFIRSAYPEATLHGRRIHFPERRLRTVRYDLEATYAGIYDQVVSGIESLKLAPYNLEVYKKENVERDDFEMGREQALVGIFKSRYLKRFESSIEAFRISVRRALAFLKSFESYILEGRLLKSTDFHKALRYLDREDQEDDVTPGSLADAMDANAEARRVLEAMEPIDHALYDLRRLHEAVQHDVEILTAIWHRVRPIGPAEDAKLERLKDLLRGALRGKKVLLFTYYRHTARYLYRHLGHPDSAEADRFRQELGGIVIRRMDSGADAGERLRLVQGFAPRANGKSEWLGTDKEIDVLISTDVLSEGQNLQDCGYLLNYDLHWNPTRLVQRAGRIDRIGSEFDTLWLYNMFPDAGLERLLGLVESLSTKIAHIDQAGFHDASILGETANPRNFNTLRRIRAEDGTAIEEEERFTELAGAEAFSQQLREFLDTHGREAVESLPDGIHSGLARQGARGVFFYFRADTADGAQHFWRYLDLREGRILDNRHVIGSVIACQRDTPRVVDPMIWERIFDLQEEVIEDIFRSVGERASLEATARIVDPVQQSVSTALQTALQQSQMDHARAVAAIRFLAQPMVNIEIRELRAAFRRFQNG
ncbi:MAG: helicase, partial [bacterium]|nr:helicase [bacterium]